MQQLAKWIEMFKGIFNVCSASIEAKVEMLKERLWVHELNKNRETEGEYHTLFSKLKKHPDKFFEHCHMDEETFNLVLDAIKNTIQKYRYLMDGLPPDAICAARAASGANERSVTCVQALAELKRLCSPPLSASQPVSRTHTVIGVPTQPRGVSYT
ncbi:hypothetical protein QTP88_006506 [Uroleucon formosanum]